MKRIRMNSEIPSYCYNCKNKPIMFIFRKGFLGGIDIYFACYDCYKFYVEKEKYS